jgi:hypothetical protein
MKLLCRFLFCVATASFFLSGRAPQESELMADELKGSWMRQSGDEEHVLLFIDGYHTETLYSKPGKKLVETRGGTYDMKGNKLSIACEFDTRDKEQTGRSRTYNISVKKKELTIAVDNKTSVYKRIDDGSAPLAVCGLYPAVCRMAKCSHTPYRNTQNY